MEIFPSVMGIISNPKFLPIEEKNGTFNNNNDPINPKNTKITEDNMALIKVICKVFWNEKLLNKKLKLSKFKPNRKGSNTKRVVVINPIANILHMYFDSFILLK